MKLSLLCTLVVAALADEAPTSQALVQSADNAPAQQPEQ